MGFYDYARLENNGIPQDRIRLTSNDSASVIGTLGHQQVAQTLYMKQGESDVLCLFTGCSLPMMVGS